MRFNKQELTTLATQPSNKFDKEGILRITEKQEGLFRKTEGEKKSRCGGEVVAASSKNIKKTPTLKRKTSLYCVGGLPKVATERWCRLRGNLLFYFKTSDQFSDPLGVIVLEQFKLTILSDNLEHDGFVFYIEFDDGLKQRVAAITSNDRAEWIKSIQITSYSGMRSQLQSLREKIEKKRNTCQDVDITMLRLQSGKEIEIDRKLIMVSNLDVTEVPICESAISCDNLLCDGNGRPPNASVLVQVTSQNRPGWIKYGRTEVIERSSNPQFLCTVTFRGCDGLNSKSQIRFTAFDVREKVSQTAVPLGIAEIALGVIQDTTRLRIPLRLNNCNTGFITLATWVPEVDRKAPHSPAKMIEPHTIGHRRSQSLPPKLGVKLFIPPQGKLPMIFTNPDVHTYRLQSGLGGDISVSELMMESQLCFIVPQQLLSIFILREKELLQEISGMGELGGNWRNRQMDLLDKHLKLLKDYSQAKQNLQQYTGFFKQSSRKGDESLEFAPVNLHLQRMWAHNASIKRMDVLDVITVGAFTHHSGKSKSGGLIKLLHQIKDSPSKMDQQACKVQAANDAVQAIKQLRKEIVDIMTQLLFLAKSKNPKGMLPLCNEMMIKTRSLLTIWEPNLVEEAFEFIENHRIVEDPVSMNGGAAMPMSPFRRITQQLGALDLKSPELEDFATPLGPAPDLWPQSSKSRNSSTIHKQKSPSATDINAIVSIQNCVQNFSRSSGIVRPLQHSSSMMSSSLPVTCNLDGGAAGLRFSETHFDVNGDVQTENNSTCSESVITGDRQSNKSIKSDDENCGSADGGSTSQHSGSDQKPFCISNEFLKNRNEILWNNSSDEINFIEDQPSMLLGHHGAFLDTRAMSANPSANYYRPTEEPEPLDLTQLNIEASVMCLVSKVKFLCGRCGSPAVRLRQPRGSIKREPFNSQPPDVVTTQPGTADGPTSLTPSESQSCSIASMATAATTSPEDVGNGSCPTKLSGKSKDLNLALTQAVGEVTNKVKRGNKFTDGLDLSMTTDWASELRPSMRKLRQAMDGLLKTARLMHSVQRLQQDSKKTATVLSIMYRRDVCFSQALTSLISGLMNKFWATNITENYMRILSTLGPLAYFEGLLSLYGSETDMWGDMSVAIEDLSTVRFTLFRSNIHRDTKSSLIPRIIGSRQSLTVLIPVPESVLTILPSKETITFKVTPVFFNIGINEKATLAETLGFTKDQHKSNLDNFDRLRQYFYRYKKLPLNSGESRRDQNIDLVSNVLGKMEESLRQNPMKNIRVLHFAEDITRAMHGIRFTSCKSAKDRTAMAVTLEQCRILQEEFHLPQCSAQNVMNTMRSEGTRSENTLKNIGLRKYAFNLPQVLSLPQVYRPPHGSYGKAQS